MRESDFVLEVLYYLHRFFLKNASGVFDAAAFAGHVMPLKRHTIVPMNSSLSKCMELSVLTGQFWSCDCGHTKSVSLVRPRS
jgi:hypothetical protein